MRNLNLYSKNLKNNKGGHHGLLYLLQQIDNVISYIYKCPNGGSANGTSITTTGTGSTCAAAYDDAIKKREAEFNSNYTKYCDCNSARWSASLREDSISGMNFHLIMTYNNPCSSTKSITIRAGGDTSGTVGGTGGMKYITRSETVPTGNGTKPVSFSLGFDVRNGTQTFSCQNCSGTC